MGKKEPNFTFIGEPNLERFCVVLGQIIGKKCGGELKFIGITQRTEEDKASGKFIEIV